MDILNFFIPKREGKSVGSFEATAENLVTGFTDFMSTMGMTNPTRLTKKAAKGVKITKKGEKYIIKLLMFEPPIELEWSPIEPVNTLFETLDSLSQSNKKIAYINTGKLETGLNFYQLAISIN